MGNTQVFGGVFRENTLKLRFRYDTRHMGSADEIGLFLRSVLRENDILPNSIRQIVVSSVVPNLNYSLLSGCKKYFRLEPLLLQFDSQKDISIKVLDPSILGTDLLANTIGAVHLFPRTPLVIVDLGTATTLTAISKHQELLGVNIMPGLKTSMEGLHKNTAQLPPIRIASPTEILGCNTVDSIQIGLYYGHLGGIREMIHHIGKAIFQEKPTVIGTGGFSHLFEKERIFDHRIPELILEGLLQVAKAHSW